MGQSSPTILRGVRSTFLHSLTAGITVVFRGAGQISPAPTWGETQPLSVARTTLTSGPPTSRWNVRSAALTRGSPSTPRSAVHKIRWGTPERVLWVEKRREDELRSLDIRVVRVTDADLGRPWPRIAARLASLVATPDPSPRLFTVTPRARGVRRAG